MLHLELEQLAWLGRSLAAPQGSDGKGWELMRWLVQHVPDPDAMPDSWHLIMHWARRWALEGFPTLTIGPTRSAALMTTDAAPSEIRTIAPPWPVSLIALKDPILWTKESAEWGPVDRVLVCHQHDLRFGPTWHIALGSRQGHVSYATHMVIEDLTSDPSRSAGQRRQKDAVAEWSGRAMTLVSRLVVGAALELSVPEALAAAKLRASFRAQQAPALTHFELGDEGVEVDVRGAVREYLAGRGRAPWTSGTPTPPAEPKRK